MSQEYTEVAVSNPVEKLQHELAHLKSHWWWFTLLGGLLALCGIIAIAYPFASSVGVVVVLGTLMLIAGIAIIVSSFWTGTWSAFLVQLLIGILYSVVGLMMTEAPGKAAGALTLLVAAMFVIAGIFRMVAAITLQFPQWGWVLLNGAVALLLGIMVFKQFPESAIWLIGTLFGVDLLFNGWTWIMLSLQVRNAELIDVDAA